MIRESLIYTASGIVVRSLSLVTAVLLRRWIPPAQFGLWNFTKVIVDFVSKFDLGCDPAIMRDLPLERGRGNQTMVEALQSSALATTAVQGLLSAIVVVLYRLLIGSSGRSSAWLVWGGAAIILLFSFATVTGLSVIKAHGRFERAGYWEILANLIMPLCLLVGGWVANVNGLIVGGAIAAGLKFLSVWVYIARLGIQINLWSISRTALERLLGFGIPMRLFDYPSTLFSSIDLLAVAALFGEEALALYSTARLGLGITSEVAGRLGSPERNDWRVRLGRKSKEKLVAEDVFGLMNFLALLVWPSLALFTYLGVEVVTLTFIPQYVGALPVLRVLLVAWLFLPEAYGIRDLWVVQAKFRILFITGVGALLAFGAALGVLRYLSEFSDIAMIAMSFLIGSTLYMGILLVAAKKTIWNWHQTLITATVLLMAGGMIWTMLGLATLPVNWSLERDFNTLLTILMQSSLSLVLILALGTIGFLKISKGSRIEQRLHRMLVQARPF